MVSIENVFNYMCSCLIWGSEEKVVNNRAVVISHWYRFRDIFESCNFPEALPVFQFVHVILPEPVPDLQRQLLRLISALSQDQFLQAAAAGPTCDNPFYS